jgi:uncharacterized protein (TIGR02391 family)
MNYIELFQSLVSQLNELPHRDESKLDALRRRAEMVIRKVFGDSSTYLKDLEQINFHPWVYPAPEHLYNERWVSGKTGMLNLFNTIIEEISLFASHYNDRLQGSTNDESQLATSPRAIEQAPASSFGLTSLHPEITRRCSHHFQDADYDEAILNAFKVVEEAVRQAAKLGLEDIGVNLMAKAFNPNNPILIYSGITAEQEGVMALYRGGIACFKNPQSHRFVDVSDPVQTFEILCLASTLCRIVDAIVSGRQSQA